MTKNNQRGKVKKSRSEQIICGKKVEKKLIKQVLEDFDS